MLSEKDLRGGHLLLSSRRMRVVLFFVLLFVSSESVQEVFFLSAF